MQALVVSHESAQATTSKFIGQLEDGLVAYIMPLARR